MASKKRIVRSKKKPRAVLEPTYPSGENTTVRIPGWQVKALDEIVEEMNESSANVNRSHLIRTAVTQYLTARGYKKPSEEA